MPPPIDILIFGAALLLLLGVLASKASGKLGIPSLVLFLLIGMLAGSEGPGGIPFDDPWLTQLLGVITLALILFSGGLDSEWRQMRPVLWRGLSLATVGVFITAFLVGLFAVWLLGFSLREGILLGAIVSSTDAAAVFTVLRIKQIRLKGGLVALLELESGSNDPMAVFLTVGMLQLLLEPTTSLLDLFVLFVRQMGIGAIAGYGVGIGLRWLINQIRLKQEGLYAVLTVGVALLTYGGTALAGGSGFLAVYLVGLLLGQGEFVHKQSLLRFHDGLAWLLQLAMFLTLGLLVFPSRLVPVAGVGLLLTGFLMVVARPVSVLIALLPARMHLREKLFVAWVGLRGAVPIILATFPLLAGLPVASTIFNVVFFLVLVSVLVQGTSITWVARWLGVIVPSPAVPTSTSPTKAEQSMTSHLLEITIAPVSPAAGKQVVELNLSHAAQILLIRRQGEDLQPTGSTQLQAGDRLLVQAEDAERERLEALFNPSPGTFPQPQGSDLQTNISDNQHTIDGP